MSRDDHFVSKTYLKSFSDEKGMLIPYYKNKNKIIGKPKSPSSICYEKDGDSNSFFKDSRILDEYLKLFENYWAEHIDDLEKNRESPMTKFHIAGYLSYLKTCTLAAKRIGYEMIESSIQPTINHELRKIELEGKIPDEIKELLRTRRLDQILNIEIEPDYPHSIAITNLVSTTNLLYQSDWDILFNNSDVPFITSDNPTALYYRSPNDYIAATYFPLTPKIAVLIKPNPNIKRSQNINIDQVNHDRDRNISINEKHVNKFNELIVKSAEKVVIHSKSELWLEELVDKYKNWQVQLLTFEHPINGGTLIVNKQDAVEKSGA
jgi:hypothetical protein